MKADEHFAACNLGLGRRAQVAVTVTKVPFRRSVGFQCVLLASHRDYRFDGGGVRGANASGLSDSYDLKLLDQSAVGCT